MLFLAAVEPGHRRFLLGFKGADLGVFLQRDFDIVEAIHEAVLAERFNFEGNARAGGQGDALGFKIDGHFAGLRIIRQRHQFIDLGFFHDDQEDAILHTIVEENIEIGSFFLKIDRNLS